MKRESILYLVLLTAAVLICCIFSTKAFSQEIQRDGNTFVQVSNLQLSYDIQTPYFYKIKEMSYSIWITPKGRCYIVRLSKKGNLYKQYLSKDICLQICKELNVEYIE